MHISPRTGPPPALKAAPQSQAEIGPSEQQTDDQKKADKQELPSHEVRSGQANLKRFLSVHDKSDKASVEGDTSANAGTASDKPSANATKGSVARRRASRASKKDSVVQMGESSAARERDAVPNRNCSRTPAFFLLGLGMLTAGWLSRGAMTGLLFNERTQAGTPLPNSDSPVTQARVPLPNPGRPIRYRHVDEQLLQDLKTAQHAMLERFGSYIPADAHCHKADVEIFDRKPGYVNAAEYVHHDNKIRLSRRVAEARADYRVHVAMHEYCHCFTHPEFKDALRGSPISQLLEESLTEQVLASGKMSDSSVLAATMEAMPGRREAQKLVDAVGEGTLMRAYFSGDADAISAVSCAAVDIYPKKVTPATWYVIGGVSDKEDRRKLAECFVGASLLAEGKVPPLDGGKCFAGQHLPVMCFSHIDNKKQKKAMLDQAKQARALLGARFDQAFYNFDLDAAVQAMEDVGGILLDNWQPVMTGKSFDESKRKT